MDLYEQKYKNALERAREMCAMPTDKATMEYIFPELKERDDEKIVDELKGILAATVMPKPRKREIFTWLEKQGKKNINHTDIKEKAHQIAWETSKDYDQLLSKEAWCEMAALDMASWLEKRDE